MEPIYIADYNYPLPDERIAKYPLAERDQSKLLVYEPTPTPSLKGRELNWRVYKEDVLGNTYAVRFEWDDETISFAEILDAVGELPIPPYLNRKTEESDKITYQTVYSRIKGSVAAPTAGLHFTQRVLDDIHARGIETDEVTLHVGAGTFLPVKTADANEHTMHSEIIAVPKTTIEHIIAKLGKIVAVGTTSMRTLESLYFIGRQIAKGTKDNGQRTMDHGRDPRGAV